jgi:threonyl-tRNA synthetase
MRVIFLYGWLPCNQGRNGDGSAAGLCAKGFGKLRAAELARGVRRTQRKAGYKFARLNLAKVPYAVVIGAKEVEAETVAPRRGAENLKPLSVGDFIRG